MKYISMAWMAILCALLTSAHSGTAHADGESQLVAPKGRTVVTAQLDVALNDGNSGEPISIAPDIWYGLSEKLSLGFVHSSQAVAGFWGGQGRGLCLSGEDGGCPDAYTGPSLLGRYDLDLDGGMQLAVDGGLVTSALDPFLLGLKLGVVGSKKIGPLDILFAPNFYLGFTERDLGNKEALSIPVSALYSLSPALALGVQTGLALPLEDAGDFWRLPLAFVAQGMIKDRYFVYGAFTLTALAGGDGVLTGVDGRTLTVGGGAAF